jgi:hypothetical protein
MVMSSGQAEYNAENLTKVSVRRFSFFMKCIAENNLWDEVELHLEDLGCTELIISHEPITAVQELLKTKVSAGEQLSSRTPRVIASGCGVAPPGPPTPVFPSGGGNGGSGNKQQ